MQLKGSGAVAFEPAEAGSADPPPEDAASELARALRRLNREFD